MPSIFLSYNKADKRFVVRLANRLTTAGVFVWLDERRLRIGDSLIKKIGDAIDRADYVGAVLSNNSVKSSWVKTELELAMTGEIAEKRVKVLPILIDDCELPNFLKNKLYADFRKPSAFDKQVQHLLKAIGLNNSTTKLQRELGISVVFSKQGPTVSRGEVVISPLEWTALFNRYLESYDALRASGINPDMATVMAVIRASGQTYNMPVFEDDLCDLESELGRKANLFYLHVSSLWAEITNPDHRERPQL